MTCEKLHPFKNSTVLGIGKGGEDEWLQYDLVILTHGVCISVRVCVCVCVTFFQWQQGDCHTQPPAAQAHQMRRGCLDL